MLAAADLVYLRGGRRLLDGLSIRVEPGRVHVVLGPNGAGKSTLLRLLAGEIAPCRGEVALDGRPLGRWQPAELARRRAVLPQQESLRFSFTAAEVVSLGRLPHGPPRGDDAIVREALAAAGVSALAARRYPTLSGGERARVQLARVLAQIWTAAADGAARYLLLDEPTAALDLACQHDCLDTVRRFAARGVGVLAVLHDPNLAMSYADSVSLLLDGRLLAQGGPREALTAANLERLYGIGIVVHELPCWPRPLITVKPRAAARR